MNDLSRRSLFGALAGAPVVLTAEDAPDIRKASSWPTETHEKIMALMRRDFEIKLQITTAIDEAIADGSCSERLRVLRTQQLEADADHAQWIKENIPHWMV